jgi:hypothetical protein
MLELRAATNTSWLFLLAIGKMLFLYALQLMRTDGYGYAVIGGAGPTDFYAKSAGAVIIEGLEPGIYRGMLK